MAEATPYEQFKWDSEQIPVPDYVEYHCTCPDFEGIALGTPYTRGVSASMDRDFRVLTVEQEEEGITGKRPCKHIINVMRKQGDLTDIPKDVPISPLSRPPVLAKVDAGLLKASKKFKSKHKL